MQNLFKGILLALDVVHSEDVVGEVQLLPRVFRSIFLAGLVRCGRIQADDRFAFSVFPVVEVGDLLHGEPLRTRVFRINSLSLSCVENPCFFIG